MRVLASGRSVRCIFPESMRHEMNRLLFKPVKIEGLLYYDGRGPHAHLVEAAHIADLNEDDRTHMLDRTGLFKDSYYTIVP